MYAPMDSLGREALPIAAIKRLVTYMFMEGIVCLLEYQHSSATRFESKHAHIRLPAIPDEKTISRIER